MAMELELWQFLVIVGGIGVLFLMLLGVMITMCRGNQTLDVLEKYAPQTAQRSEVVYSSMVKLPPMNQL